MRFEHPLFLLLLLPLAIGLWLSYRHVHGMAKGRKRLAFVVRSTLLTLLVLALSGPESRRPNQGLCTIFVVDRSDSISDSDRKKEEAFVRDAAKALDSSDQVGVVVFGKDAAIESAPSGRRELGAFESQIDASATDISAAVRLASATFPDGKGRRIVLLTDGEETQGDLANAAQVAATDGITLDHVTLGTGPRSPEAAVVSVETPEEARVLQPIDVRAVIDSTVPQTAGIDLDRDGVLIHQMATHLEAGRNALVFTDRLASPGFHRYRVTIHPTRDTDNRNNVGLAFVAVRGKPRVLVLQEHPEKSPLVDALRKNGIVTDLDGPETLPTTAEELQAYDALILNDINANSLTVSQMKIMQAAVRDTGIGFAMIGGENSFLPGGYYNTPVAEVLPVDLNIRQRKSFPATSVCIMCDTSGSMGMREDGVPKVRLAAKAAEDTVRLLSPNDRVAVAGSTDGIEFVVPMQSAANKTEIIPQIERLSVGGGGIYCRPSMLKGEEVLNAETTNVRHFMLLSDGNDAEDQDDCYAIALRMRQNHITTSVVAIGDGKDVGFLRQLAAVGGGRFYLAKKAGQLPAVMTQDTSLMSRSAIEEGVFFPKLLFDEPVLKGIDETPALFAYDLTDTRPLSRVGMRTKKDDPLLATWQYGLGTSIAFTSDAQARWAQRWVGWSGFGAFWSQAVREITRRATQNDYQVDVHREGGKAQVEIRAQDTLGNPLTASNATVRVTSPKGVAQEVALTEEAPGKFDGQFEASDLGSYIVSVSEPDPRGGQRVSTTGFSVPYPPEYRTSRPNSPLLTRTSEISNGKELTDPVQALRPIANPGVSITELHPLLLLLAALLLPFDVAVRRLALPLGEIFAKVWARLRSARTAKPSPQPEVMARLQRAKERGRQEDTDSAPLDVSIPSGRRPDSTVDRPMAGSSASRSYSPGPASPGSAAKGLLEAKRAKKDKTGDS